MMNNWELFVDPNGGSFHEDPLMPRQLGVHWIFRITSFVENTRYIYVPRSLALQQGLDCVSKFAGTLVPRFNSGTNSKMDRKKWGDHIDSHLHCSYTSNLVKRAYATSSDLTRLFQKSKYCRKFSNPMHSLVAALVSPFINCSANAVMLPLEANGMKCIDRRPPDIERGDRVSYNELHFQNSDWSKTAIEPKTGIEFPTILDSSKSGDSTFDFTPEVLVGTGSRTITIIRIKSLEIYAFGFYIHPFDVREKLGRKYISIPEYEMNKRQRLLSGSFKVQYQRVPNW